MGPFCRILFVHLEYSRVGTHAANREHPITGDLADKLSQRPGVLDCTA